MALLLVTWFSAKFGLVHDTLVFSFQLLGYSETTSETKQKYGRGEIATFCLLTLFSVGIRMNIVQRLAAVKIVRSPKSRTVMICLR